MATTALATQFRDEFVSAFEYGQSMLMGVTTMEAVVSGKDAIFATIGTGGEEATERSYDGEVVYTADDLNQITVTLKAYDGAAQASSWNMFASQGTPDSRRRAMFGNCGKKINRKVDALVITALNTATNDAGSAATMSLNQVQHAIAVLGNEEVDVDEEDNMFCLASPAARGYLSQIPEFNSADYVEMKPLNGPIMKMRRWAGLNWIFHPRVPGVGTAAEKLFVFHRRAIGLAMDRGGIDFASGYEDKHQRSWARATVFAGAGLLQNSGVAVITHDGSAYVAS